NSIRYRYLKQPATMFLSSVVAEISDLIVGRLIRSSILPSRMSPMLVEIALIILKFVLQVISSPKERVIK
ncbi:MAG: hypothetical protein ACI9JM_001493, partial [Halioglobus sp.]